MRVMWTLFGCTCFFLTRVACNCNFNGSTALSKGACDDSGQCVCREGVTGLKCSVCDVRLDDYLLPFSISQSRHMYIKIGWIIYDVF